MILYHAVSTYQLLHSIVHRKVKYEKEKAIIILSDNLKDKFPNYIDLKDGFFDEVLMFSTGHLFRDKKNIIENTDNYFRNFLNSNEINLKNLSDIIVGCAHNFFGIFLIANNINFTFMEDASGLISRPEVIEDIEKNICFERYLISKQFGLFDGKNELILKKICNMNNQKEGYFESNVEHFDLVVEMSKLSRDFIEQIIEFFGVLEKISIEDNSMIILTQHFTNLNIMSLEEQKQIYKLVVDYFSNDYNLVFKPHPDDLLYYDQLFDNSKIIKTKFPAELIPFVFTNHPKVVMTITSTAINNLSNYFEKTIKFSSSFEKDFFVSHKYYTVIKIISYLKINKIYELGTDKTLLKNMAEFSDASIPSNISFESVYNFETISKGSVLIIDDYMEASRSSIFELLNSVDEQSIIIFINSKKDYKFYDYPNKSVLKYIVPVEISFRNDDVSEIIYIYSKRSELRDMINSIQFEKTLKHSEITFEVQRLTEEQMKIKVLEGILEATEKRLEHYIKLEKELRDELNKQKD